MVEPGSDGTVEDVSAVEPGAVRSFQLAVLEGEGRGREWRSTGQRCCIGTHASNDLLLADAKVSRFHCEVRLERGRAAVHDVGSTNGTALDGVPVVHAYLRAGSQLRLGETLLRFEIGSEVNRLPLSEHTWFGSLLGRSVAMREVFARLEKAAASTATVLLEGETGTGKTQAAEALHREGPRRDKRFVVVDCSAIPATLLESELFGHERGAFTGAEARRAGAFEQADGGTLFLDEIGELPLVLQPKLLRFLESREVQRVGGASPLSLDVRVVAGTNRGLRAEVNAGRFRPDLFFRLAVIEVHLPPLRNRPEDVPMLVEALLERLGAPPGSELRDPELAARLSRAAWPGNVRELRNWLERSMVYGALAPVAPGEVRTAGAPFSEARQAAIEQFERGYLTALMSSHRGKMGEAAASAGISRVYLYKLLVRHGLK